MAPLARLECLNQCHQVVYPRRSVHYQETLFHLIDVVLGNLLFLLPEVIYLLIHVKVLTPVIIGTQAVAHTQNVSSVQISLRLKCLRVVRWAADYLGLRILHVWLIVLQEDTQELFYIKPCANCVKNREGP